MRGKMIIALQLTATFVAFMYMACVYVCVFVTVLQSVDL